MSLHDDLRQCLLEVMPDDWVATLQEGDDLFALMDSIDVVRLVDLLQSRFGITISNSEMTPENLGTLANIAGMVERKTSNAAQDKA